MGTNYYHESTPCPCCGVTKDRQHIGKSSAGWCFSLHIAANYENGPTSLDDWRKEFAREGTRIVTEYGDTVTPEQMLDTITNRTWPPRDGARFVGYRSEAEFHRLNESENGPNGLLRHRINGRCVGHGDGTYDLITGEFS